MENLNSDCNELQKSEEKYHSSLSLNSASPLALSLLFSLSTSGFDKTLPILGVDFFPYFCGQPTPQPEVAETLNRHFFGGGVREFDEVRALSTNSSSYSPI